MVIYTQNKELSVAEFRDLLKRTTLHRQLNDEQKLDNMLKYADFLYTAWDGEKVIGFTRGITDHADVIYIADLGIDKNYWHQGIGTELMKMVTNNFAQLHIVLVASKLAENYYSKIGFTRDTRGYLKNPQHLAQGDWIV